MATGIVLGADGAVQSIELGTSDREQLATIQGIVGGYAEALMLHLAGGPSITVLVNEDGQRLGLPVNLVASDLVGRELLGDVVLAGGAGGHGELLELPAQLRGLSVISGRIDRVVPPRAGGHRA